MLYSCTHMATVGVKSLNRNFINNHCPALSDSDSDSDSDQEVESDLQACLQNVALELSALASSEPTACSCSL